MEIYENEIKDGLEYALKNNAIAFTCVAEPTDDLIGSIDTVLPPKAVAKATDWDLFPFTSILVSTGWNANDDVFIAEELWRAKDTPLYKRVNYQHREAEVIGVITASTVVDFNGNILDKYEEKDFDIVVAAVLYKRWQEQELQDKMDMIIANIMDRKYSVSMECLFKHFDYALIDQTTGARSFLPRTKDTSFLTKYLRIYGGPGVYKNKRIGRLLRDFTFSGKGIVDIPANQRSIIVNFSKAEKLDNNIEIEESINKLENNMELEELKAKLAKAEEANFKLQEQLKEKIQAVANEEKAKLEKDIEKLNSVIAESHAKNQELAEQHASAQEAIANLEKTNKELIEQLSQANSQLEEIKKQAKASERRAKLTAAGIDNVDEILSVWSEASDAQFEQIIELSKKAKAEPVANLENSEVEQSITIASKVEPEIAQSCASYLTNLFKGAK